MPEINISVKGDGSTGIEALTTIIAKLDLLNAAAAKTSSQLDELHKTTANLDGMADSARKAGQGMKEVEQDTAKATSGFSGMVKGAADAYAGFNILSTALNKSIGLVADVNELGVASLRAKASLDAFSDGKAADYLEAMRASTKGLVSDQNLAAASSKALMLHVADGAEQMGILAKAGSALGLAVGKTATEGVDTLTLALSRVGHIQLLDNIGLDQKTIMDRFRELKAVTANEQDAWSQAVLENATSKTSKLESMFDGAGTAVDRLTAKWNNFKASASENVAVGLGAIINGVEAIDKHYREQATRTAPPPTALPLTPVSNESSLKASQGYKGGVNFVIDPATGGGYYEDNKGNPANPWMPVQPGGSTTPYGPGSNNKVGSGMSLRGAAYNNQMPDAPVHSWLGDDIDQRQQREKAYEASMWNKVRSGAMQNRADATSAAYKATTPQAYEQAMWDKVRPGAMQDQADVKNRMYDAVEGAKTLAPLVQGIAAGFSGAAREAQNLASGISAAAQNAKNFQSVKDAFGLTSGGIAGEIGAGLQSDFESYSEQMKKKIGTRPYGTSGFTPDMKAFNAQQKNESDQFRLAHMMDKNYTAEHKQFTYDQLGKKVAYEGSAKGGTSWGPAYTKGDYAADVEKMKRTLDDYAIASGQATKESLFFRDAQEQLSKQFQGGKISFDTEAKGLIALAEAARLGKTSLEDTYSVMLKTTGIQRDSTMWKAAFGGRKIVGADELAEGGQLAGKNTVEKEDPFAATKKGANDATNATQVLGNTAGTTALKIVASGLIAAAGLGPVMSAADSASSKLAGVVSILNRIQAAAFAISVNIQTSSSGGSGGNKTSSVRTAD
jgi:hypothetical protein